MKSYATIAKQLVKKNASITEAVTNNPGANYKPVAALVTARLCSVIGAKEDFYIKRNELVWACINQVEGVNSNELDY